MLVAFFGQLYVLFALNGKIAMSGLFVCGWPTGVLVSIVGKTYKAQFYNLRKPNY